MKSLVVFIGVLFCASNLVAKPTLGVRKSPIFRTVVTTKNITGQIDENVPKQNSSMLYVPNRRTYIDVQVVDKPHNLFIGRCLRGQKELHGENIILNNDGKSHVTAEIRINVEEPVDITCVKVLDQLPGSGAYPSYLDGGVGHNFVEIGVSTRYGQGFHFFIQIFGPIDKKENAVNYNIKQERRTSN